MQILLVESEDLFWKIWVAVLHHHQRLSLKLFLINSFTILTRTQAPKHAFPSRPTPCWQYWVVVWVIVRVNRVIVGGYCCKQIPLHAIHPWARPSLISPTGFVIPSGFVIQDSLEDSHCDGLEEKAPMICVAMMWFVICVAMMATVMWSPILARTRFNLTFSWCSILAFLFWRSVCDVQ